MKPQTHTEKEFKKIIENQIDILKSKYGSQLSDLAIDQIAGLLDKEIVSQILDEITKRNDDNNLEELDPPRKSQNKQIEFRGKKFSL